MKQTKITSRYAKSLLILSIEKDVLEGSLEDMKLIESTCCENRELKLLLQSPVVKTDKKLTILNNIFSSQLSRLTMLFIKIITTKKREMYLDGIAESFINQYKKYKNIESATITTSIKIDEENRKEILSFISNNGAKEVELTEVVEEDIIGGIIIRMEDKQLDTSISRSIKQLKQEFNKNLYVKDF